MKKENLILVSRANFNRYNAQTHTLAEVLKLEGYVINSNNTIELPENRLLDLNKIILGRKER